MSPKAKTQPADQNTDSTDAISDQELLLQIARESLRRNGNLDILFGLRGTTTVTNERPRAAVVEKKAPPPEIKVEAKTCPHCGETKPGSAFGTAMHRGRRIQQSWCHDCRSATSAAYYANSKVR